MKARLVVILLACFLTLGLLFKKVTSEKSSAQSLSARKTAGIDSAPQQTALHQPPQSAGRVLVSAAGYEPLEVQTFLWDFRGARSGLFFDQEAFVRDALEADGDLAAHLGAYLADLSGIQPLTSGQDIREERPQILLDRMAGIDLLEAMAAGSDAAVARQGREVLRAAAVRPIDGGWSDQKRRVALAEKYDLLTALTHVDAEEGLRAWRSLGGSMRSLTRPGMVGALIDRGLPRDQVARALQEDS